jgi:hypothetical protein
MADEYDQALARIALSGLDERDFELLGFEALSGAATKALHPTFIKRASIKIRYWDPEHPERVAKPWAEHPAFYRIRYLTDIAEGEDKLSNKEGKEIRYTNEPGQPPMPYFPRSLDWAAIFTDPSQPIVITEGEFKAAAACKFGVPTIGLGGVNSYQSKHLGLDILPDLLKINWVRRSVYICYDSDFRTNPNVLNAINALAKELMMLGAYPNFFALPDEGDGKVGLDDYLVANPEVELAQILLEKSQPLTQAQKLHEFNDSVCYIKQPGLIVVRKTGQKITPAAFVGHAYSNLDYAELQVKSDSKINLTRLPLADSWLKWPFRFTADRLTYAPGGKAYILSKARKTRKTDEYLWNVWTGWGCEPVVGDPEPFLILLQHLFKGVDSAGLEWFLDWLAYPLQYPGTKLFTSVLMYGTRHGTGKSLVGYTMKEIYGANFTEISQNDLHGNFNEWAEAKQFVMGDDVAGSDKRQDNDLLKKMITQRELRVNTKFMPSYTVPDCINYLFNSNHPDSFFLEDHDRRFFIHEVQVQPLEQSFYVDYVLWLETGGAEAVFKYLLDRNVDRFNPSAPAYVTQAKSLMINDMKSDLSSWVKKLYDHPDDMLVVGGVELRLDLYSAKSLLALYDPDQKTRVTASGLARELRRYGLRPVAGGKLIKSKFGPDRYFALRNVEHWESATNDELCLHLDPDYKPTKLGKIASKTKAKKY